MRSTGVIETKSWRGYGYALLAALGWASGGLISKWIFNTDPSITAESLSAARVCSAVVLLGLWLIVFDRKALAIPWSKRTVLFIAVFGAIAIAGMQYTYLKTISLTNVATAILLEYLAPLFTLAAGVLIFKQKLHVQTVLGACGALLGCAIAVGAFSEGGLSISPRGLMWGITSAFFFALYTVMGSRAGSRFEPFGLQFYGMVCASIMWLVVLGPAPILAVFADLRTALMLIVISITSTTLAFGLYLNAMRLISATHAAITAMAEPIIAGIIAALFLGERMTLSLIMGGALVIGSIILIQVSGSDAPV